MKWITEKEAVQRFMVGDDVVTASIHMPTLAGLIREGLARDGHAISLERIWSEVIDPPMEEAGVYRAVGGDHRLQEPSIVYLYYADWVANIGQLLGINPDVDIQPDWLAQNPCTQIVTRAMVDISIQVIDAATRVYEAKHGHSMLDAFLLSSDTGEDFEQSRIRLTAQRSGLRTVH